MELRFKQLKSIFKGEGFKLAFDTTLSAPLATRRGGKISKMPATVCLTYSEITMGSFRKILAALMKEEDEDYRLSNESTFLDIGHGLGACVYQAAFQVGCVSQGVEYAQNKFVSSCQVRDQYLKKYGPE